MSEWCGTAGLPPFVIPTQDTVAGPPGSRRRPPEHRIGPFRATPAGVAPELAPNMSWGYDAVPQDVVVRCGELCRNRGNSGENTPDSVEKSIGTPESDARMPSRAHFGLDDVMTAGRMLEPSAAVRGTDIEGRYPCSG